MIGSKPLCVIALLLLALVLYFQGLGRIPFYGTGEAREAVEVQEEIFRGEWILPLRDGFELPSKPPLFHWLGGVTALARGTVDELTVRLPSALLATATLLLVFWFGARRWGIAAGAYSACILGTSFLWIRTARSARVDMTLTAFLTGAFVAFDIVASAPKPPLAALAAFYLCMALAVLAKGPIGILLPSLAAFTYLAARRDLGHLRRLHVLAGGAVALAIPAAWYGLAILHGGEAFVQKQLLSENVNTFIGPMSDPGTPPHAFYYVVPAFLANFAPWSFFLVPLGIALFQDRKQLETRGYSYPLLWFTSIFLFFAVASGKRSEYLLPIYPAAALLLGAWWSRLSAGDSQLPVWALRALQAAAIVAAALVLLVILVLLAGRSAPPLTWVRPLLHPSDQANLPLVRQLIGEWYPMLVVWGVLLAAVVGLLLAGVWYNRWPLCLVAVVAAVASTAVVANEVVHPALARRQSFKSFLADVRAIVPEGTELAFYNTFDYGAIFYWGERIPVLQGSFDDFGAATRDGYLLMWESEWKRLAPEAQARLQIVRQSDAKGDSKQALVLALIKPEIAPASRP